MSRRHQGHGLGLPWRILPYGDADKDIHIVDCDGELIGTIYYDDCDHARQRARLDYLLRQVNGRPT